ncbi:MAG: epimerase [Caulobacter sp. 12-67-6]|nr:MAG: epimerase [Caulobacter sp. 12-67-6]OYX73054.1 MAG: epimerase [Caulobacter sp. 32-67-35]OZA72576.1 MAG: epimerase [Caulobacter sp. 39-67-4]HQR89890.1 NAD-dependent epimerase/dehydratase family protein [Caulobacter sp.]
MSRGVVAVTGATGFLGRRLVTALFADGWTVRILARRDIIDPDWAGLEPQVVIGGLSDPAALERLCSGAAVIIHVAGLIKARSRAEFDRTNVHGARDVASAAKAAGGRLILVSSLAAREPGLSDYAASKRGGEDAARDAFGERLTIVRPPAIYGPGDMETLGLFKAAQSAPFLPVLDPAARIAMIHVDDAVAAITGLAGDPRSGLFALSDSRTDGYSWTEVMTAAAGAVGKKPHIGRVPTWLIKALARLSEGVSLAIGKISIFTTGKAREMLHLDWSVSDSEMLPRAIAPRYGIESGFAQSVQWYRAKGFLVALREL